MGDKGNKNLRGKRSLSFGFFCSGSGLMIWVWIFEAEEADSGTGRIWESIRMLKAHALSFTDKVHLPEFMGGWPLGGLKNPSGI